MKLESLTELLPVECQRQGFWVEQEGEEVYLKKNKETIAQFKGSDQWSFENLMGAASQALSVSFLRGV